VRYECKKPDGENRAHFSAGQTVLSSSQLAILQRNIPKGVENGKTIVAAYRRTDQKYEHVSFHERH
jgi:hypothetical protein